MQSLSTYFDIINFMISGEWMSAELKRCVMRFIYFLDPL